MILVARYHKGPVLEASFEAGDLLGPTYESLAKAFEKVMAPGLTSDQKDEIYEAFTFALEDDQASHLLAILDPDPDQECPIGYLYYQILPEDEEDESYLETFQGVGDDLENAFEGECGQRLFASDFGFSKSKPAPAPTFDPQALALVNKHRAKLGMVPIDPAAGWTTAEIDQMAASIRKTGRMANPRVLPLIEIPRR